MRIEEKDSLGSKVFQRDSRLHPKIYLTLFGKLELKRYAYRPVIRTGDYDGSTNIYPLDVNANLDQKRYSFPLQELAVLACTGQSYEQASKLLDKVLKIRLCVDTLERIAKDASKSYDRFYDSFVPEPAGEEEIVVVSADGKGVPMTKEASRKIIGRAGKGEKKQKKKEALVGVTYSTKSIQRTAISVAASLIPGSKTDNESVEQFKTENIKKMASLEKTKKAVMLKIKAYSEKISSSKKPIVVMDGARGLWTIANNVFGEEGYIGILDIIHVRDYLYTAGHIFYKEGTPELRDWVYTALLTILNGKTNELIVTLKKKSDQLKESKKQTLQKVVTYFSNHLELMKYDTYLTKGYPIASGVVESACSQVVANRMELPGARWTVEGAEAILKHRSISTSNHWDEYWSFYKDWIKKLNYANNIEAIENIVDSCKLCG